MVISDNCLIHRELCRFETFVNIFKPGLFAFIVTITVVVSNAVNTDVVVLLSLCWSDFCHGRILLNTSRATWNNLMSLHVNKLEALLWQRYRATGLSV